MPFVERHVPVIADERVEMSFGTGALKITPGARPDRLRDRPRPRAARADGDRPGRADERGRGRARGPHAGRGGRAHPRLAARARPAREARVVPAHRLVVRPLQDAHRAADLAAVVVLDGGAEAAGARRAALGARHVPSRVAAPLRDRLARGRARLEHLAPDLVGPPAAALGMPGRPRHGAGDDAGRVRRVRLDRADAGRPDVLDTWFSSALWPFATLGWPERHRGSADVLSRRHEHDRARHHPPLGEPDDLRRARADGRGPVHATSSSTRPCTRRPAGGCRRASAPA